MSKTKSTSTSIKDKIKQLKEANKQVIKMQKGVADDAVTILKDLINGCDMIEAIRWSQYTPYFNDGDACEFSINDVEFKFSEEFHATDKKVNKDDENDDNYEDEDGGFMAEWELEELFEKKKDVINYKVVEGIEKAVEQIQTVHSELSSLEAALKEKFGDHVQITVTRKGIETEEYSHD